MRDSLHRCLVSAEASFDVWEGIQEGRADHQKIAGMQPYAAFFNQAELALLESFIVNSYSLFETGRRTGDTVNFRAFLNVCKADLDELELSGFEEAMKLLRPTWTKIAQIRNSAIGHRSSQRNVSDVFKKAGLTAHEIGIFLTNSLKLLNEISKSTLDGGSNARFNLFSKVHTENLLDDLRSLKK